MEFAEKRTKKKSMKPRRTLLGGAVVLLLAAVQFFAPAHLDLWWQAFFQALHAPVFGLIAVCLLAMTPSSWHWQGRLVITMGAVLLLAILSEIAQIPMPNRSASVDDLVNDLVGALAFVSAAVVFSPNFHVPSGRGRWLILLAIVLLAWPLKPLASISAAYWERYEQLPSIAPFDSTNSRLFYHLNNALVRYVESPDQGRIAPEFRFGSTGSSSIDFHDPWSDWRSYTALIIDIENLAPTTLPLTIRVHDEAHLIGDQPHNDRFNRVLEIVPGPQTIRIELADIEQAPASRDMEMEHIDGVVLFGSAQEAGSRFIIHDMRLE
jgi:VanZ family protein